MVATIFGRPFLKRFALLCYQTVLCPVCPVSLRRWCTVAKGWMDQDETWHAGRPRPGTHCARWGPSSPVPQRGTAPHFSAHFYYGQTAGCIKMPLGVEVGLSPWDFVLDGDPAPPPQKGADRRPPIFGPCLLWPNGWWIKMPLGTEVGLGPGTPPVFSPCLLWPNGRLSQLLLSSCLVLIRAFTRPICSTL